MGAPWSPMGRHGAVGLTCPFHTHRVDGACEPLSAERGALVGPSAALDRAVRGSARQGIYGATIAATSSAGATRAGLPSRKRAPGECRMRAARVGQGASVGRRRRGKGRAGWGGLTGFCSYEMVRDALESDTCGTAEMAAVSARRQWLRTATPRPRTPLPNPARPPLRIFTDLVRSPVRPHVPRRPTCAPPAFTAGDCGSRPARSPAAEVVNGWQTRSNRAASAIILAMAVSRSSSSGLGLSITA